ncbi:hypothetical protein [Salibacterium halotolerans]|uniref:hypothetical protein n=1 Tax=Salibacterium halotolerans TaxID=1884432 RepID=UPI0011142636|nr:hypothetical protein [Salibacterium halotolerans]
MQKRFYKRWKRERHQKTGWIILKETIRSSVTMFMYVSTGFFMVEGLLPTDILYAFLTNPSGLSAFLIVNAAAGTTARFENEKRYNRIVDEWMDEGRSFPDAKE